MSLAPCRVCGLEISTQAPACPKCGQPLPTKAAQATAANAQAKAGATLLLIVLGGLAMVWYGCRNYEASSKESDAAFCKEWLSYYEALCRDGSCSDTPRKLARCDR